MMDDPERDGEGEYGLVIPFLPVASKGGPYDDEAFVAGFEMGRLDEVLRSRLGALIQPLGIGTGRIETMIHTPNAAQADLIAMRHGYSCTAEVCEEAPEWTRVIFEPARESALPR
jgi:hypothetical protein